MSSKDELERRAKATKIPKEKKELEKRAMTETETISITMTARIIDNSTNKYTEDQLNDIQNEIEKGVENIFTGNSQGNDRNLPLNYTMDVIWLREGEDGFDDAHVFILENRVFEGAN